MGKILLTFLHFSGISGGSAHPVLMGWILVSNWTYKDMILKGSDSLEIKFWFIPSDKPLRPADLTAKNEVSSMDGTGRR